MKCSVFVATSLEGYIARTDGSIDWLEDASAETGEDYGFRRFFTSVDALVSGLREHVQDNCEERYEKGRLPQVSMLTRL